MTPQLEQLETRDVPSVTVHTFYVAPGPDGSPGGAVLVIQGDPAHSPGHIARPAAAGDLGQWLAIINRA
jgi:hypothetical protein